ncbi:MAG: cohesin domain-containing protein [Gemmatimonadota bacterium]
MSRRELFADCRLLRRRVVLGVALIPMFGCNDARQTRPDAKPASDRVEAELLLSRADAAPDGRLGVVVRVMTGAKVQPVASFTARIAYDATRLRFDADAQPTTEATVINGGETGVVRLAGFRSGGFAGGTLATLTFLEIGDGEIGELRLLFDELHAIDREDLSRVKVLSTASLPDRGPSE